MGIQIEKLEIDDWFTKLPEKIDLWITDPPYPFDSQNGTGRYKGMYKKFTWQKLNDVFVKMYEKTNEGGRAYVFANRDGLFKTMDGLVKAGFDFLNILIWDKQHFGGGYHWRRQEEYIVYVSKGHPKTYVKNVSNIFNYKRPSKSDAVPSIGYNPKGVSVKPHQIWKDIITHGGCQDDVCADPFAGTNPMRAALLLNAALMSKIKDAYTNVYLT